MLRDATTISNSFPQLHLRAFSAGEKKQSEGVTLLLSPIALFPLCNFFLKEQHHPHKEKTKSPRKALPECLLLPAVGHFSCTASHNSSVLTTFNIKPYQKNKQTMITPPSASPLGLSSNALFSYSLHSKPNCHQQHHPSMHLLRRSSNNRPLSASIHLPKSHVHCTRLELQLAEDVRRAGYEDVHMCVRLVVGMQSQCIKSGYVHPLTKHSLQEILRTKAADERELKRKLREHHHAAVATEPMEEDERSPTTGRRPQTRTPWSTPPPLRAIPRGRRQGRPPWSRPRARAR